MSQLNKFYLHLGPHKTASTSLQRYVFPGLPNKRFIGRKFDDLLYGDELYRSLMSFCCAAVKDASALQPLQHQLKAELSKTALVLSDEWFTADYDGFFCGDGCAWDEKLRRLHEVVDGLDVNILYVERPLVAVSFSLYCEFRQIPYGNRFNSFEDFCRRSGEVDALVNGVEFIENLFVGAQFYYGDFTQLNSEPELFYQSVAEFLDGDSVSALANENSKRKQDEAVHLESKSKLYFYLKQNALVRKALHLVLTRLPIFGKALKVVSNLFLSSTQEVQPTVEEKENMSSVIEGRKRDIQSLLKV